MVALGVQASGRLCLAEVGNYLETEFLGGLAITHRTNERQ